MDSNHPGLFLVYSFINKSPFEVCKNDLRILKILQILGGKNLQFQRSISSFAKRYWNNITGPKIQE